MTPARVALAAAALAAGAVAVAFTWQPGLASLFDDSVSYLVLAQAVSPGHAAPPAVLAAAPLEKYPPLTAWLVALAGGAFDWRFAHAVIALAFGASVWLLGAYARVSLRSETLALGAALAYAFMPGAWLNVKGILSEFPYMALSFAALALHGARGSGPLPRRTAITLGLLLAAAFLARTIAVALIAAIAFAELIAYWRQRDTSRLRALAWTLGIAVLAAAAWYALRPAVGEDAYAAFGSRVVREAASERGLGALVQGALGNASALWDAWLNAAIIFWGEPWKPGFLLATAIGIAGLASFAWRAARGEADGLYVLFFLAILLVWPFPGQMFRLALPVLPLLLVAFIGALLPLTRRTERLQRLAPWSAVIPLALFVPATLFYIAPRALDQAGEPHPRKGDIAEFYRIPARASAEASATAQLGVFEDLARVGATTPDDARVMWYWPNYMALLAQRHGVRLERPRDVADLARQARERRAGFIYLGELHPRDSARREGHPLAPYAQARELGRVLWHRATPAGNMQGVLIELDPRRIEAALAPGTGGTNGTRP